MYVCVYKIKRPSMPLIIVSIIDPATISVAAGSAS